MNNPLVSVLIPVYNVEEYLGRCLDSVINQTLVNIEIICVNDGSTDKSAEILEKYKKLDSRIKIVTKENGGLPSARNAGLDQAQGKYVGFVDSDDFVQKDMFSKLVETAENTNSDIVICGANILPETPRASDWLYSCLSPSYCEYEKFNPEILYSRVDTTPFLWRCLIRRELIEKNNYRLDEDIIIGEDKAFQCKVYPAANKITVIPDKLYNYFWCRPGSLMQQQVYGKFEEKILAHAKLVERIGRDLLKRTDISDMAVQYQEFCEWSIPFIYDDFMYLSLEKKQKVSELLMPVWKECNIYTFLNAMPEWKQDAFNYIRSFVGVSVHNSELSVITVIEYTSKYVEQMLTGLKKILDDNKEIIIINNGMSNENYVRVQKFLYKNKNVRLYNTSEHQAYGEALNMGIYLAASDYVVFLDSQDWFASKALLDEWLYESKENMYDICASDYSLMTKASDYNNKVLASREIEKVLFKLDYHNFMYKKEFLIENKVLFSASTVLTGFEFLCKAIVGAKKLGYFEKTAYVLREMHVTDWISTEKCEQVLECMNELVDLSLESKNAYLHGAIFSMLNGDKLKQIIVNNTKPYCMPTWKCPEGENSQIKTVKNLFEIVMKADVDMLQECGYEQEDSILDILFEVVEQRQKFLGDLSDRYIW